MKNFIKELLQSVVVKVKTIKLTILIYSNAFVIVKIIVICDKKAIRMEEFCGKWEYVITRIYLK